MSMALALARAMELNDNQPELQKEEAKASVEAIVEIPLTEKIAKKINIASGEDANFDLDPEDAWAWHAHEHSLNLGNPNAY